MLDELMLRIGPRFRRVEPAGAGRTIYADELAARLPRRAWQRLSAGKGAKGLGGVSLLTHPAGWIDAQPGHRRTPR